MVPHNLAPVCPQGPALASDGLGPGWAHGRLRPARREVRMATSDSSVRNVGVGELRGIVLDSDELKKGTEVFDRKEIGTFARHGNKLFAEAKGSEASPYKVT